jgi:23S rRNA (uracil1939-C5)-methyltransferase
VKDRSLTVGDFIEVTTERLAYGGGAIAHHNGLAILIKFAAPKERLRVRITERRRNFARGVIDRILEPSASRREPPCKYFGSCGGCQLQHLTYKTQLEAKVSFIRDALERIGRVDWPSQISIHHGAEFGYRARARIRVDRTSGRVGFIKAGSNTVCDVTSCPILVPALDQALHSLRNTLSNAANRDHAISANLSRVEIAAGDSAVSFEPAFKGLSGGALHQTVRNAKYDFGPSTFFQGNPDLIGDMIDEAVGEVSGDFAIDLYAGVGLFTIQLARRFNRVVGVEADPVASRFAADNISSNHATNVEFHNSAAELWLERFLKGQRRQPDFIVLNPPRTGAAQVMPQLVALNPFRITYVSCDPATLARDLRPLLDSGYKLLRVTAIDLFPQTYHVETVAALQRPEPERV